MDTKEKKAQNNNNSNLTNNSRFSNRKKSLPVDKINRYYFFKKVSFFTNKYYLYEMDGGIMIKRYKAVTSFGKFNIYFYNDKKKVKCSTLNFYNLFQIAILKTNNREELLVVHYPDSNDTKRIKQVLLVDNQNTNFDISGFNHNNISVEEIIEQNSEAKILKSNIPFYNSETKKYYIIYDHIEDIFPHFSNSVLSSNENDYSSISTSRIEFAKLFNNNFEIVVSQDISALQAFAYALSFY